MFSHSFIMHENASYTTDAFPPGAISGRFGVVIKGSPVPLPSRGVETFSPFPSPIRDTMTDCTLK